MIGKIHSCGYQDSGIAHNCCNTVDRLKKRIEECKDFMESGSSPRPQTENLIEEFQKILEGKK